MNTTNQRAIVVFKKLTKDQNDKLDDFFKIVTEKIFASSDSIDANQKGEYNAKAYYQMDNRFFKLRINFTLNPMKVTKNEIIEIKKGEYEYKVNHVDRGQIFNLDDED